MLTLYELKEKLLTLYDPDDILMLLEIEAEELLDRFEDRLIINFNKLQEEVWDGRSEEL